MRNVVGSQKQTNYGIIPETAPLHADGIATREALRLAALVYTKWPSKDEQLVKIVSELVVKQVQDFAIAARRAIELEGIPKIGVLDVHNHDGLNVNVEPFSGTLRDALGMIIHARKIIVVTWTTGNKLFSAMGDRRISHLNVQSERGEAYICPFGLAHTYLSRHSLAGKAGDDQENRN